MRIDVRYHDRVGLGEDILMMIAQRHLLVSAIEIASPHIYIDVPELNQDCFDSLRSELLSVFGVTDVFTVDMLPSKRQRLYLDALIAGMDDPVLAVDAVGAVVIANGAAANATGSTAEAVSGELIGDLFNDPVLHEELVAFGFRVPLREVMLKGQSFLLDVKPMAEFGESSSVCRAAGGILTLHAPTRIGQRLYALQHTEVEGFENLIGESPPMRDLKARGARIAAVEAPVLIQGETGTGKELIAVACHAASTRARAPFLALNCAAMPENLAESELFGYSSGAFSGAQRGGKPGLLELADKGTVFLDEIGEMSPYLQAKLLRFLNDGTYRRVGGDRELKVDVRIISATHRDLEQMVAERSFREDLYYRLNVLALKVPPLRERGEDVLLLARHAINRACTQARKAPCRLSQEAGLMLQRAPWPGNVRQLQNVIFRAVTMCDKPVLDAMDFELAGSARSSSDVASLNTDVGSWVEAMERYEKQLLQALFPLYPSSRKLAAHLKASHTMIAAKLRKHDIRNS